MESVVFNIKENNFFRCLNSATRKSYEAPLVNTSNAYGGKNGHGFLVPINCCCRQPCGNDDCYFYNHCDFDLDGSNDIILSDDVCITGSCFRLRQLTNHGTDTQRLKIEKRAIGIGIFYTIYYAGAVRLFAGGIEAMLTTSTVSARV